MIPSFLHMRHAQLVALYRARFGEEPPAAMGTDANALVTLNHWMIARLTDQPAALVITVKQEPYRVRDADAD